MKKTLLITFALLLGGGLSAQMSMKELPPDQFRGRTIELRNPLLTVTIGRDQGGMVRNFIPAVSNHDEVFSNDRSRSFFCRMRVAEMNSNESGELNGNGEVRIVKNTPQEIIVSCVYKMKSGRFKDVEFEQTHTMKADSALLASAWKITNRSKETVTLTPWIQNIASGHRPPQIQFGAKGLDTDTSIMLKCGAFRKLASGADCFVEPARNWFARVPKKPEPGKNIVLGIFDYNEVFQFYTVHFKYLHTLELIFRQVELKPGASWTGRYLLASGGPLADVRFASPEIAADLNRKGGQLELQITSPRQVDKAEVVLLTEAGKTVGRRKTSIRPCQTVSLAFPDAAGDRFELKVIENGRDLMKSEGYTGKGVKMVSTLKSLQAPRRPEHMAEDLEPWKRTTAAFQTMKPREVVAVPLKTDLPGLQVWPADSLTRVLEQDYPVRLSSTRLVTESLPFELRAAKAEREYFQLAVRNSGKNEMKDFSVELSIDAIPAENLRWNVLEYITTTQPSLGRKIVGRWPEVLDPARSFAVKPGQTRTVWIEVLVPRTAKAGSYSGKVRLLCGKRIAAELPVKLRVFGFELPKTPNLRLEAGRFFGNYTAMAKRYGFKGTRQDLIEQMADLLLTHRMSPRGLTAPANGDLKKYEAALVRHIRDGANTFFIPSLSVISKKRRNELEKIHDRHGVTKLSYVYAFDEIHADQIPRVRQWCETWHKESKIPILVVFYGGPVKPLYGSIDIWCRANWKENEQLFADRLGKDEIWITNTPLYPLENERVLGRAQIWRSFSEGMKGCLLWSVASWTSSPYVQPFRSGTNLTGVFFYPSPEGLRPGVRFKVMSDASEDFDYLCILREEVRKAKAAGRPADLVKEAETILSDKFYLGKTVSAPDYQARRSRVGELIEKLKQAK